MLLATLPMTLLYVQLEGDMIACRSTRRVPMFVPM
jgi:hypothetical protein